MAAKIHGIESGFKHARAAQVHLRGYRSARQRAVLRPRAWKAKGAPSRFAGHSRIHGRISGSHRDGGRDAAAAGRRGEKGIISLSLHPLLCERGLQGFGHQHAQLAAPGA